jgi:hypothetical protein
MTLVRTDRARLARALRLWCVGLVALFAGCGGNTNIIYGTAVISVQDTSGQFLSYQVGIDSITLTRNDGIVVEPLSTPQTVDFTQITDIPELLGSPALPTGSYISVSITLDYTTPSIWAQSNGQPVELTPVDTSGAVMSAAVITVTFDPNNPLVINSQQSTRLAIDLDLAASSTINTSSQVVVQPFMYATPAAVDSTVMRARGLYVTQMSVASGFIMNARPFIDQVSALGAETVNTTATTYFNINGTVYVGSAGLAALAAQPENSLVVAYGTLGNLSGITPTFNATSVYAGLIVQSPINEEISGVVSARSGNTLTIAGGTFFTPLDQTQYVPTSTVTLGSNTLVSVDGTAATGLTSDSVSVGQQVIIFGQSTVSATNVLSTDATAGAVRLQPTRLWGTLNSATPGSASLNMLTLQNFDPAAFTFAGTGTSAAQDATPAAYVVNTGSVDESAAPAGTVLQVDGLVSPFGTAPPDFTATAITPGTATEQELVVIWNGTGATAPFTNTNYSAGLTVNLASTNISTVHYIATGPSTVDLTTLPASPLITTANVPQNNLQLAVGLPTVGDTIGTGTSVTMASSLASFDAALTANLNATNGIYSLVAVGQYDSATNTFNATKININLY